MTMMTLSTAFGHAKLVHSPNEMTVAIAPLTCNITFDQPTVELLNAVIPPVLKKMQFTELFKAALANVRVKNCSRSLNR